MPLRQEEQHNEVGKLVEDIQKEMVRMAEEIGLFKEENRVLKKGGVLAEDSSREAGIEAR